MAVHIGARVAGIANAGATLVSNTVKDLVSGSGLHLEDRGSHALKGVPGEWRLYEASGSPMTLAVRIGEARRVWWPAGERGTGQSWTSSRRLRVASGRSAVPPKG